MIQKVGIDAGGSLIKLAYEEKGHYHYASYPMNEGDKLLDWLSIVAPNAALYVTGGKSRQITQGLVKMIIMVDEFQAMTNGARTLLAEENLLPASEAFLLVSIGTGTSIYYVNQAGYERLFGSGIGGGTLVGLGSILTGKSEYTDLIEMVKKGDRKKADLLVKDIYAPDQPPLLGELTAANFGKVHLQSEAQKEDYMASLVQLIGETILLLVSQAAIRKQTKQLVFVGTPLMGPSPIKDVIVNFQDLLGFNAIFLQKGAYVGARGALLPES